MKRPSWRSVIAISALIGVALWANPASSFDNEPTGYGGLQWGTTSTDGLDYLEEDPNNLDRIFVRFPDTMSLGDVEVYDIEYLYNFMDEFYSVVLKTTGTPKFNRLSSYLSEVHGPAEENLPDGGQVWRGETTEIWLDLDPRTDSVTVTYTGVQVVEKMLKTIDAISDVLGDPEEDVDSTDLDAAFEFLKDAEEESNEEQDNGLGDLFR